MQVYIVVKNIYSKEQIARVNQNMTINVYFVYTYWLLCIYIILHVKLKFRIYTLYLYNMLSADMMYIEKCYPRVTKEDIARRPIYDIIFILSLKIYKSSCH